MRARPTTPDPALAGAVKRLREERSWTQEDLAYASHLTVSALARIERATANPSWATVRQIAHALDVSMSELGGAVDEQGRPGTT